MEKFDFTKIKDKEKFEKLSKEEQDKISDETQKEAIKIQAEIENGEAKDYSEAEKLIEKNQENLDGEISPEAIESIMNKVQDLNKNGTAFTHIGLYTDQPLVNAVTNLKYNNSEILKNILKDGLIGIPAGFRGRTGSYEENRQAKELWYQRRRIEKDYPGLIYFNILGRTTSDITEIKERLEKINFPTNQMLDMGYGSFAHMGGIKLIVDVSSFEVKDHDGQEIKDDKDNRAGAPACTINGLTVFDRIAPRFFRGIVIQNKKVNYLDRRNYFLLPSEITIDKMNKETLNEILNVIASSMKEFYKKKSNLMVPVYDIEGNLLWPRQMSYEELRKFTKKRDRKRKEETNK